jgi:hypothetical protein
VRYGDRAWCGTVAGPGAAWSGVDAGAVSGSDRTADCGLVIAATLIARW